MRWKHAMRKWNLPDWWCMSIMSKLVVASCTDKWITTDGWIKHENRWSGTVLVCVCVCQTYLAIRHTLSAWRHAGNYLLSDKRSLMNVQNRTQLYTSPMADGDNSQIVRQDYCVFKPKATNKTSWLEHGLCVQRKEEGGALGCLVQQQPSHPNERGCQWSAKCLKFKKKKKASMTSAVWAAFF